MSTQLEGIDRSMDLGPRDSQGDARYRTLQRRKELVAALKFIGVFAVVVWTPLALLVTGGLFPWQLFDQLQSFGVAFMFLCGAIIASATAVGGGMVFNPTLQMVFGVSGFSALALAVLVQVCGMSCGAYGWYKQREFSNILTKDLRRLVVVTVLSAVCIQIVFVLLVQFLPNQMLLSMKIASALVSFYVSGIVWGGIRNDRISRSEQVNAATACPQVAVDRRIYPFLCGGVALNVATTVGVGELVTSHLIKFYDAPPKTAVAVGVLLQAVCVATQAVFILAFFHEYIIISFVLIGVMLCAAGGRLAPWILSARLIEPYAKHILALAALAMGITSMLLAADSMLANA
jgi:uncharacterized membrane protein YfcA